MTCWLFVAEISHGCRTVGAHCPRLNQNHVRVEAELARIALTSLSSLSVQRSLHRERAHENAVAFSDPVPGHGSNGASEPDAFQEQLSLLIDGKAASRIEPDKPEEPGARDPRAALSADRSGVDGSDASHLVPMEIGTVQLPKDVRAKDAAASVHWPMGRGHCVGT